MALACIKPNIRKWQENFLFLRFILLLLHVSTIFEGSRQMRRAYVLQSVKRLAKGMNRFRVIWSYG